MSAARNTERTFSAYGTGYGSSFGRRREADSDDLNSFIRDLRDSLRGDYERTRRGRDEVDTGGARPIEVNTVVLYVTDNAKDHHTDRYELLHARNPSLVLRRGFPFFLAIRFKRPYDPSRDLVKLEFYTGPRPSLGKGTLVQLPVTNKKEFSNVEPKRWEVRLNYYEGTDLHLQIQIPSDIPIGIWKVNVITQDQRRSRIQATHKCKENIYILFNPWDKDDGVYMENENWRREYVLNDVGKIFMGTHSAPRGRRWIYGQYKDSVLPACMYLLGLTRLDGTARANPAKVARAIAAAVNSNDDNGVLTGNWSGKYDDGVAPWMWTGSAAILEKFMEEGGRPVRYGQCWVFGGITTTVCRALGIPCRTVTNFVSAHDTDDTMTIDKYFDKNGEEIKARDSIWNFHVWNDAWMTRPDLPSGYGGWQAIDATPQETSEGVYRAGPCSLVAIRRGEIGFLYDTPFIFSEVNADIVHWQRDETSNLGWKRIFTNKYHVGRLICSKAFDKDDDRGDSDMEIIMDQYKTKEGSVEERMSIRNAMRIGGVGHRYDIPTGEKEDVVLDLVDIEKVMIGKPFHVTVKLENKSNEIRTVWAVLSASSVYYTGIIAAKVKRESVEFVLRPKQIEVIRIEVKTEDYLDKLVDYSMIKIYAIATIKETKQTWTEEDDFQVEKPKLDMEISGPLEVGKEFNLIASFTNPLDKKLTDCTLSIEGSGVATPRKTDIRDVGPRETFTVEQTLKPHQAGETKLVAIFDSRQLNEIIGSLKLEIQP